MDKDKLIIYAIFSSFLITLVCKVIIKERGMISQNRLNKESITLAEPAEIFI